MFIKKKDKNGSGAHKSLVSTAAATLERRRTAESNLHPEEFRVFLSLALYANKWLLFIYK